MESRTTTATSSMVALQSTTTLAGGHQAFFALFPDGVHRVRLTLRNGTALERRPTANAVLAIVESGVATVTVGGESQPLHDDPLDPSD